MSNKVQRSTSSNGSGSRREKEGISKYVIHDFERYLISMKNESITILFNLSNLIVIENQPSFRSIDKGVSSVCLETRDNIWYLFLFYHVVVYFYSAMKNRFKLRTFLDNKLIS